MLISVLLIVSSEISRPAGRDQGFPIALDLRPRAVTGFAVFLEIGMIFK